MKNILYSLLLILAVTVKGIPQEEKLEEILQKYYKASGTDHSDKIQTLILTGTISQQDIMPVKVTRVRPDKFLMEFDLADISCIQAYDGTTAWMTAPYTGNPRPQIMPEERARDIRVRADFDGILFNWKSKGYLVELQGKDTVQNVPAYKLKVVRPDGGIEFYYISIQDFMLLKRSYLRMIQGRQTDVEIYFKDYRNTEGLMIPFLTETFFGGQRYSSTQFDQVDVNMPVENKIFLMPAGGN